MDKIAIIVQLYLAVKDDGLWGGIDIVRVAILPLQGVSAIIACAETDSCLFKYEIWKGTVSNKPILWWKDSYKNKRISYSL